MQGKRQDRTLHLFVLLLSGFVYLGFHLVRLTVVEGPNLRERARAQRERSDVIPMGRGRILDATGKVLAGNVPAVSLYSDAQVIETLGDAERAFEHIQDLPGVDRKAFFKNYEEGKRFFWIVRNVDPQRLPFLEMTGGRYHSTIKELPVLQSERRVYPKGSLAGYLLGFTGVDHQGLEGLELQFDEALKGKAGRVEMKRDGRGRPIPGTARVIKSAEVGKDVQLTLDAFVQHSAEQHLEEAVQQWGAKGGHAVVVEAATGRVLAMASVPRLDPGDALKRTPQDRRNRMITDVYEPGSVFKTILAAAALEENIVSPTQTFRSTATMKIGRFTIKDSSKKDFGMVTLKEILQKSMNIGAALVGFEVGDEVLKQYVRAFGFDRPTGLELAYESHGLWPPEGKWGRVRVATVSYGHGIGVTPVQVARAYTAIANGGVLLPLHLVESVGGDPKTTADFTPKPEAPVRVIGEETAHTLVDYLVAAAEDGTGEAAVLDNYHVAGKTGTTRKTRKDGRGYESRYIGSFAGFFPATRPQYVIVVTIDEPRGSGYGGVVAAPVFKKVAEDMAFYYKITPDKTGEKSPGMALKTGR